MKTEICRRNKQHDLKQKKKKVLKIVVLLGCWVCPCGWGWLSVLWCFPGWGSLYLCSGWPNWISSLWRATQCPVVGLGGVYGFSISLGSPSDFCSVRHIYFHNLIKLAHSAYLHCRQPPTCPWNLCQCFCPLVLPCTADWSLLGRGLCGSFLVSLTLPSSSRKHTDLCGLPLAPWSWPLHGGSRVHLFQFTRPALCVAGLVCSFQSPGPPSVPQGLCSLKKFVYFASLIVPGPPSVEWGFCGFLLVPHSCHLARATVLELFMGWEVKLFLFSAF